MSVNSVTIVKLQSEMPVLIVRDTVEFRELPVQSKTGHMGNDTEPNGYYLNTHVPWVLHN